MSETIPAAAAAAIEDTEDTGGGAEGDAEQIWDLLRGAEPGVISEGRYRLYKTPEGGLHLVTRPGHLGTDVHFPLPAGMITALRVLSKGPVAALARRAMQRSAGEDSAPGEGD